MSHRNMCRSNELRKVQATDGRAEESPKTLQGTVHLG